MINQLTAKQLGCYRQANVLFRDVTFDINEGEALLIQGENGSGKSTLLRLLTGLASPQKGHVEWQQQAIGNDLPSFHESLHYLGHNNGLKLSLTVDENIRLFQCLNTHPAASAKDVLATLKLEHKRDALVKDLSAGQRRRVGLAKLLLIKKPLWILDEPFTALDIETQQILTEVMTQHVENKGILILTSHQPIHLPEHIQVKQVRLAV